MSDATFPTWFRYGLVALATLILCSCSAVPESGMFARRGAMPMQNETEPAQATPVAPPEIMQCQYEEPVEGVAACGCCGPTMMEGPRTNIPQAENEYLCDGGDFGLPAGVRADWTVDGLEQEDAIAHYDTVDGRTVVTPSNRVCIYAPRFAAVRRVTGLTAQENIRTAEFVRELNHPVDAGEADRPATSLQRHAAVAGIAERNASLLRERQQAGEVENLQAVTDIASLVAPYSNVLLVTAGIIEGRDIPAIQRSVESAITWTGVQAPQVVVEGRKAHAMWSPRQVDVVYTLDEPNDPFLRLVKLASTHHALPGEEVEFTLRFDNVGDREIGNVTILDNLTTRLEYVPGSAQSSVDAKFSTEPNSEGSEVLRWEIIDPVEPGEGGVLTFRTRVR